MRCWRVPEPAHIVHGRLRHAVDPSEVRDVIGPCGITRTPAANRGERAGYHV